MSARFARDEEITAWREDAPADRSLGGCTSKHSCMYRTCTPGQPLIGALLPGRRASTTGSTPAPPEVT
jgi:hypothetical protein